MSSPFKHPSPSRSPTDSYQRKIYLLQAQNMTLVQELQSLRYKLRSIEDIQVKYQLLLGQSENQNQQLKLNQIALAKKLSQEIALVIEQKDHQLSQATKQLDNQHKHQILTLRQKHQQEKQEQQQKYSQLKQLYQQLSAKSQEIDVFSFKLKKYEKQVEELEEQLETQRQLSENNKEKELSQLKLALTKKLKLKYDSEIESNQSKIKQLNKRINQLQLENDLLNEKSKSVAIVETSTNIDKLTQILAQRKTLQRQEKTRLEEALDKANSTLRKVIQEKYQSQQKSIQKQQQLKQQLRDLQTQLLQKQKSHTKQLFTLKEKYLSINQQQTLQLNSHIQSLKDKFQNEKLLWENLSQDHAEEIKSLRQENHRVKVQYEQEKARFKNKIKSLKERLEDAEGKRLQGETQQMIQSLKDIDGREDKTASYQNGIVFFQRQLAKANMTIAKKDKEIAKLLEEITRIRAQNQTQTSSLREKHKTEKKQSLDKIFLLQNQVIDLSDKLRFRQRELQKREKDSSFRVIQLEKKIQALQDMNNQIKKDYDRAVATSKTLQEEYRGERDRGVSAKGDANYAKRIKWLELEKQKNQLTIIFREKQQQLKILYEKQIDALRNERDSLKQKATLLEDDAKRLSEQNAQLLKKLNNKENLAAKSTKKKAGEMEKKIASLNLEISLTKNLFENLEKAKSRLKARDFTERSVRESESSQQGEENQEDFD